MTNEYKGEKIMSKIEHSKESLALADAFLKTYDPKSTNDIQSAFKDMLGPVFEAMLKGELTNHLGFENNNHQEKDIDNRRNGTSKKVLKSSLGEIPINAPKDTGALLRLLLFPKNTQHIGHRIQNNFNVC